MIERAGLVDDKPPALAAKADELKRLSRAWRDSAAAAKEDAALQTARYVRERWAARRAAQEVALDVLDDDDEQPGRSSLGVFSVYGVKPASPGDGDVAGLGLPLPSASRRADLLDPPTAPSTDELSALAGQRRVAVQARQEHESRADSWRALSDAGRIAHMAHVPVDMAVAAARDSAAAGAQPASPDPHPLSAQPATPEPTGAGWATLADAMPPGLLLPAFDSSGATRAPPPLPGVRGGLSPSPRGSRLLAGSLQLAGLYVCGSLAEFIIIVCYVTNSFEL
ncbi:hypothetical protein T492DRAFT_88720 [Pavlovales sp. CCMP2436]|nr:hypothetical protein T492DRAFT_88720 [Pavlovales sp. CCMP2436]